MIRLAFPHAATLRRPSQDRRPCKQAGLLVISKVTQTSHVCAPEGSHRGTVWQTKRGRAASEVHVSGTHTAGESRLGPYRAPFPWSSPLGPSTAD